MEGINTVGKTYFRVVKRAVRWLCDNPTIRIQHALWNKYTQLEKLFMVYFYWMQYCFKTKGKVRFKYLSDVTYIGQRVRHYTEGGSRGWQLG